MEAVLWHRSMDIWICKRKKAALLKEQTAPKLINNLSQQFEKINSRTQRNETNPQLVQNLAAPWGIPHEQSGLVTSGTIVSVCDAEGRDARSATAGGGGRGSEAVAGLKVELDGGGGRGVEDFDSGGGPGGGRGAGPDGGRGPGPEGGRGKTISFKEDACSRVETGIFGVGCGGAFTPVCAERDLFGLPVF